MDGILYIKSLIVGAIIALPLGPVGALSVRRVISYGRTAGMVSALGGSLADLVYVVIVRLGLTGFSAALLKYRPMFHLIAVALVVCIGVQTLAKGRLDVCSGEERFRYDGIFTSSFILSVINPTILFTVTILFTSIGLDRQSSAPFSPVIEVAAIFAGSAVCWMLLTTLIDRFGRSMTQTNLNLFCRIAGGLIIVVGLGTLFA